MTDIVVVTTEAVTTVVTAPQPVVSVSVTEGRGPTGATGAAGLDGATGATGATGPTGPNIPNPNGFLAETVDLMRCTTGGTAGTAGTQLKFGKVWCKGGVALTTLSAFCTTASTLTLTNTYMAIYDLSGNLLRACTSSITSAAIGTLVDFPLSSSYTPAADGYLLFALQVGGNGGGVTPQWAKSTTVGRVEQANINLTSPNYRVAQATGSNGAMPNSLASVSGTNENMLFWFGAR